MGEENRLNNELNEVDLLNILLNIPKTGLTVFLWE